jgi:RND family efflux transporter MFP subunit
MPPSNSVTQSVEAIALLSIALSGVTFSASSLDSQGGLPVTVSIAKKAEQPEYLKVSGQIVPWEEASVSALVSGLQIVKVGVRIGDKVTKGEQLALLDDSTILPQLTHAEAAVAEASAAALEATSYRNRANALGGAGALSAHAILQATTKAAIAEAELTQAKTALTLAQWRLGHTHIISPDSGVISSRTAELGEVKQSGEELFRIIRQDRLEWRPELTGAQIATLHIGLAVRLQIPDGPVVSGRIRQFSPSLSRTTRLGFAFVDLDRSAVALAGMYVSGDIEIARREVVLVPTDSVVVRDGHSYGVTLSGDFAKLVPVTVGQRLPTATEILSGIEPGIVMIVRGAGFLGNGTRVRVVSAVNSED